MNALRRPALKDARALLDAAGLPVDDLSEHLMTHFLGRYELGRLIAVGGLEVHGSSALLRSVATSPAYEGQGLAGELIEALEQAARAAGVANVYLLTTTAGDYFRRRGYVDVARERAPPAIRRARQFSELCPGDADFLHKELATEAT